MVWKGLITSLLRYLLAMVLGPLVLRGILGKDVVDKFADIAAVQLAGIVVYAALLLWTSRNKFVWWRRLKLAVLVSKNVPPEVVVEAAAVPILSITPLLPSTPIEKRVLLKAEKQAEDGQWRT